VTRAIAARRKGDEYQARVFWLHLLGLRTGDFVESVSLESDGVSFVDDVVVTYSDPICDPATGQRISCDCFQCKYHVTQGGAFTYDNLFDPTFINCKSESMLKRLYSAYLRLSGDSQTFRLYVVSNWFWHPDDEIARHLSEEMIRHTFYEGGPRSKAGIMRSAFADHLSIPEGELRDFLDTVRFRLGRSLADLTRELEVCIRLANLQPIDPTATSVVYDDLAWKLFAQRHNRFDRRSFDEMIREEKLIVAPEPNYSEISMCSCPQGARRPRDVQAAHLDLSDLFDGRFPLSNSYWQTEIPERVASFLQHESTAKLPQPIHLFFDCHLSIAFLVGGLTDPKYGIQIVPAQKTRASGYEFWPESMGTGTGLWHVIAPDTIESSEVVVGISVTNPIDNHLFPFLEAAELDHLPRILLRPASGVGPRAVSGGEHAWQLGLELQTLLRDMLPVTCRTMHLFFSGPVALAYIVGNTIRYVTSSIQLYEHDFEGRSQLRYYPSIRFPIVVAP